MVRYFKIIALLHNWHALKDIIVLEYDVIIHKVENFRLGHNYIYTRERRKLSQKRCGMEFNQIHSINGRTAPKHHRCGMYYEMEPEH